MSAGALCARDLSCAVGGRTVLSHVGLDVEPGSMLAVVGVNGSGKSTLLRTLSGLLPATGGAVEVDGLDVHALASRERARRIAFVDQDPALPADLLVGELVGLGRTPYRSPWSSGGPGDRDAVRDALHHVDLMDAEHRSCATLSGGEMRRAWLARGIAQDTGVLVLDEPTNHLDVRHQLDLLRTVRALGRTTVAAVHDLGLALACFDRVLVLHDGRAHAVGAGADVLTPDLVAEVFGVAAVHVTHPVTGRTHLLLEDLT